MSAEQTVRRVSLPTNERLTKIDYNCVNFCVLIIAILRMSSANVRTELRAQLQLPNELHMQSELHHLLVQRKEADGGVREDLQVSEISLSPRLVWYVGNVECFPG